MVFIEMQQYKGPGKKNSVTFIESQVSFVFTVQEWVRILEEGIWELNFITEDLFPFFSNVFKPTSLQSESNVAWTI